MKKLKNYSFILVLFAMMAGAAMYFTFSLENEPAYQEISVKKGDSLWTLAEEYQDSHDMNTTQFIEWVQKKNNLITTKIVPGEQIVIPVVKDGIQIADAN